ncbi:MAG: O-antigen ligase family protein [Chloroflexi bacterium]|nr:MAG: O-antigen ligase family protein [Chloroflexota bacterium]
MLFEEWGIAGLNPLTGQVRFFQNVSGYSEIPIRLSFADLLALLTFGAWLLRRLVGANAPARLGPLGWPVLAYTGLFGVGFALGLVRGGSWNQSAALAELRGPLFLCITYLLTVNLVRDEAHVKWIVRLVVALAAVKAAQGLGNYVDMVNGPVWLEAVTAHEDVVFLDLVVIIAVAAFILGVRDRFAVFVYGLIPVIALAELVTQRRVAFIALGGALLVTAIVLAHLRPRQTLTLFGVAAAIFVVYTALFWDQTGLLAGPVRAIKGAIDSSSLSARDLASNWWRELENANIAYTIRQLPLTGVGLGQEYLFVREPPQLTNFVYWRYMTHDAVLWVWLKTGILGFFAFWTLVVQTAVVAGRLVRQLPSVDLKLFAIVPLALIVIQVVFSTVDLGLTYSRCMIVLGVVLGLTSYLSRLAQARGLPT